MILRQTLAIFHDAYRELNAKKLFWITLAISIIVVVVYAMFSINKEGVHFLWFTFPNSESYAARIAPEIFFKFWMYAFGIGIWLTWVATVLALISTASIFPDLLSSGAIDLQLSKPISRLRLFLTKFLTGLLFVAFQVGAFVIGCMLVIGFRAGTWEWSLLLAIPIVLAFFSYLYAICTLFGVITRSTITALLLTLLAWFALFGLNQADMILLGIKTDSETRMELAQLRAESNEKRIASLENRIDNGNASERTDDQLENARETLEAAREEIQELDTLISNVDPWHDRIFIAKTTFPKTAETIELLSRYTLEMDELAAANPFGGQMEEDRDPADFGYANPGEATTASEVMPTDLRMQLKIRSRSLAWVLGTSFAFSAAVLGIGAFIFCRRDF